MNFWKNVDYVREYREMTRKELAYQADFSIASFSTGIKRNSIPAADVAYRISKVLDVSIEYLLTGKNLKPDEKQNKDTIKTSENKEYQELIKKISLLPKSFQDNISSIVNEAYQLVSKKQ